MAPEKETLDRLRIDRSAQPDSGRSYWIPLLGFFVLAGLVVLFFWLRHHQAAKVRTVVVQEHRAEGEHTVLNASGYVTARREATVSSKVTGKITEVLIEEGMTVEADQVLARLDTANVEANLKLAEAQMKVARAAVEETKVRLREAEIELRRISSLVDSGVATPSQLDAAQAEVDSLRARLVRQEEEISVAEQQIALWRQEMEDRIIRAPFAGVVISKDAQAGEMISPVSAGGGFTRTGVCTLVDMASLEIEVDVNESYINRVRPEQSVEATLDAYPTWRIPCRVIAVIPTADRQKATVKVRIGFQELDSRMLPDMGVKVAFREEASTAGAPSRAAVRVPSSAVRQDGTREVVFVLRHGKAERRAVTVGDQAQGQISVLSGLEPGERVIVEGPADLTDGTPVMDQN